jgi:predicted O-methyltransferase YrrM
MNLTAALATEGWMAEDELIWLAEQAQSCHEIIEVGCWKGRSTLALADNTPGHVWAVDHWRGTAGDPHLAEVERLGGPDGLYQEFCRNMGDQVRGRMRDNISILRMDASEAASYFRPASVDLIFIDASHIYADVKRDLETYRPFVKPGGILCGHDYACPVHIGVQHAVDALFPTVNRAGMSIWWIRKDAA